MLQQELQQAHRYNGHDHEDDNSDDDDEEVPQREGEPEAWMLLCRLNQHYDDIVSQGNRSPYYANLLTGLHNAQMRL